MLASFEKTADHLFDAAYFGQKDSVCGRFGVSRSFTRGRCLQLIPWAGASQEVREVSRQSFYFLRIKSQMIFYHQSLAVAWLWGQEGKMNSGHQRIVLDLVL